MRYTLVCTTRPVCLCIGDEATDECSCRVAYGSVCLDCGAELVRVDVASEDRADA